MTQSPDSMATRLLSASGRADPYPVYAQMLARLEIRLAIATLLRRVPPPPLRPPRRVLIIRVPTRGRACFPHFWAAFSSPTLRRARRCVW